MAKSWAQKLETGTAHVEVTERAFAGIPAGVRMLISTPKEVRALVSAIPKGHCLSIAEVQSKLAHAHDAEATCPLTVSIFLRIVAEAAWDEHLAGKPVEAITPFWRAIGPKDKIAAKLRCGAEFLAETRSSEGIAG